MPRRPDLADLATAIDQTALYRAAMTPGERRLIEPVVADDPSVAYLTGVLLRHAPTVVEWAREYLIADAVAQLHATAVLMREGQ